MVTRPKQRGGRTRSGWPSLSSTFKVSCDCQRDCLSNRGPPPPPIRLRTFRAPTTGRCREPSYKTTPTATLNGRAEGSLPSPVPTGWQPRDTRGTFVKYARRLPRNGHRVTGYAVSSATDQEDRFLVQSWADAGVVGDYVVVDHETGESKAPNVGRGLCGHVRMGRRHPRAQHREVASLRTGSFARMQYVVRGFYGRLTDAELMRRTIPGRRRIRPPSREATAPSSVRCTDLDRCVFSTVSVAKGEGR